MTYRIAGLSPDPFRPLFQLSDEALQARLALRRTATSRPGFPCRVSLEDAETGESLILLNYESHSALTPYRTSYAIFVREAAVSPACYTDELPPVFQDRPIALRMFDTDGLLVGADLGRNADIDTKIRQAFARQEVEFIHAHNAMHGCFSARIDRTPD